MFNCQNKGNPFKIHMPHASAVQTFGPVSQMSGIRAGLWARLSPGVWHHPLCPMLQDGFPGAEHHPLPSLAPHSRFRPSINPSYPPPTCQNWVLGASTILAWPCVLDQASHPPHRAWGSSWIWNLGSKRTVPLFSHHQISRPLGIPMGCMTWHDGSELAQSPGTHALCHQVGGGFHSHILAWVEILHWSERRTTYLLCNRASIFWDVWVLP